MIRPVIITPKAVFGALCVIATAWLVYICITYVQGCHTQMGTTSNMDMLGGENTTDPPPIPMGSSSQILVPIDQTHDPAPVPVLHNPCPVGMQHIVGNFCPNVEQNCKRIDKSIHNANGYVKCDEFYPSKCLSKNRVHMDYCMDTYEYPNVEGQLPTVMVSWNDMKKNCEDEGKRLCVDKEWTFACEGEEMLPYPYGLTRDATACNIDHPQKPGFDASKAVMTPQLVAYLNQSVPSGSMERCVSPFGVKDMTGNCDENVVNSNHGAPMDPRYPNGKKQYWSAEMGGHWVLGARNRCRPKTTIHDEGMRYYIFSGRCCSDSN